jgi:TRAP-type C4-dicarboxylate transport system permease small subunit
MSDQPRDRTEGGFSGLLFERLPRLVIGTLLIAMVAINSANVIGRHVFSEAIFWSEEIMRLLLVWGVYLGAVAVTYRSNHLTMDLFTARLASPYSTILNSIVLAVFLFIFGYIAYYSWQVLLIMNMTGRVSDAAKYPIVLQHAAVFAGLVLMALAALTRWKTFVISSRQKDE